LGALAWACSIYEGTTGSPPDASHPGVGGAGPGSSSTAGEAGGAGGSDISSTTDTTSGSAGMPSTTTGPGGAGTSSGGVGGGGSSVSSGGSGGAGRAGSGGTGGAGNTTDAGKDQSSEPAPDAKPDTPPDDGCPNPTLCTLRAALLHRYTFDGTGTSVTDSIGTAHGTVMNAQLSGNGTVVLAGGSTDQYVDLPNGIIKQLTNATFEAWVTWNGGGAWQRIFDFGDSSGAEGTRSQASTTLYLTPQAMMVASFPGPPVMVVGFKRSDVTSANETHVIASQAMATAMIVHVALVIDDTNNQMTLYKNGAFESSVAFTDSLSMLNDVNNWLGRSQYAVDSGFGGTIHEFRIYGAALSQSAVQASYVAGTNPAFLN
jgi:hypothetical protein